MVIGADRYARVAELVDARDLKSLDQKSCGFDSRLAHQIAAKRKVTCFGDFSSAGKVHGKRKLLVIQ